GHTSVENFKVNFGTLMSRKPDKSYFPRLFCLRHSFHATAGGKNSIRIVVTNDLVKLHQVNVIRLKSSQRLINLLFCRFFASAVDLRHEESLLPITIQQCFTHADLALAIVVVPTVIEEVNTGVEGSTDNLNALFLVRLTPDVISAKSYGRNFFARSTKNSVRNSLFA